MSTAERLWSVIAWKQVLYCLFILTLALLATHAFAGTTGAELKPAADKVAGLIGGWGGKLLCLCSLALGVLGSLVKFNPYLIAGCFGVCVVTALGVAVINASVTALI